MSQSMEIVERRFPIIVVDLDGTLCDARHREHLAQQGLWDEFHALCIKDPIYEDVAGILAALDDSFDIIALTGRNEKWRQATYNWLGEHKIDHLIMDLLMRPDDNFSPDIEMKPSMLFGWFGSIDDAKQRVHTILEDRDKVVEVWRQLGFNCWQVRPGGY